MAMYAYHKGPLDTIVGRTVELWNEGRLRTLLWAVQVANGGCQRYAECSMSPAQLREVAGAMCATNLGAFMAFAFNDRNVPDFAALDAEVAALRSTCR